MISLKIFCVCVTLGGMCGFTESRIDEDFPHKDEESIVIIELLKRMENMESKMENVLAENDILRRNQLLHTDEIQQLKTTIQSLEEKSVNKDEGPESTIQTNPSDQQEMNQSHLIVPGNAKPKIRKYINRRVAEGSGVAFLMKLTTDLKSVQDNQHLPFNRVYTNIGGEYDVINSVFVCQTPGVYVFQNTILATPNAAIQTAIVKNGAILTEAYGRSNSDAIYDSGSTMAVTELNAGDRVWVKVHREWHIASASLNVHGDYSSFTGFLLYQR